MKKIVMLLVVVAASAAVFAQSGRSQSRDVILGQEQTRNKTVYGNGRYDRNIKYSRLDREEMINRVRREYKWKIESVKRDRYLRNAEKKRQIRFLEMELDRKIMEIRNKRNSRYDRNRW